MRVVVQRCLHAKVTVEDVTVGEIERGLLLLVGFTENDTMEEVNWMVRKIAHLRIFDDEEGVMNCSIQEVDGSILSVSQFTLYADCEKGNRPSYMKALPSVLAEPFYDAFNQMLEQELLKKVETGRFGAMMKVSLTNDGPVTILLER